jgi:hypothetical protein
MNSLKIITKNFEPNTKLSKKQISDLEDKIDNAGSNREITIEVAKIIRDNTLSKLTENELDRMIYMLEEKKGSIREIQSIILRILLMAIPSLNGGKRKKKYLTRKKLLKNTRRK